MIDLLYFKWTEPVINDLPNHLLKKKQYFNNRLAHKMYEKRLNNRSTPAIIHKSSYQIEFQSDHEARVFSS